MLHILDVSGFVYRAFHTTPPMYVREAPVNAVFGFCRMALAVTRRHIAKGDSIVAVFDPKGRRAQHRVKMFKGYKANRPPPPLELKGQFARVREAAAQFGINPVEPVEDVEADDLIASYAVAGFLAKEPVRIHSSDKDLCQLVGPGVEMWDPLKGEMLDQKAVEDRFGIPAWRIRDMLALMGDKTDNVPGVPGIGKVHAKRLVTEFGGVEDIIGLVGRVRPAGLRARIADNIETLRLSLDLVTLKDDCELPIPLPDLVYRGHAPTLLDWLEHMNFPFIARELEKETA